MVTEDTPTRADPARVECFRYWQNSRKIPAKVGKCRVTEIVTRLAKGGGAHESPAVTRLPQNLGRATRFVEHEAWCSVECDRPSCSPWATLTADLDGWPDGAAIVATHGSVQARAMWRRTGAAWTDALSEGEPHTFGRRRRGSRHALHHDTVVRHWCAASSSACFLAAMASRAADSASAIVPYA